MKNWLGQEISVGDLVYRGARDGDTSSYKIGIVKKLNLAKNAVTVSWKFEWFYDRPNWVSSSGSPSVNTLLLVDRRLLKNAAEAYIHDDGVISVYNKHQEERSNGCYGSGSVCQTCEGFADANKILAG